MQHFHSIIFQDLKYQSLLLEGPVTKLQVCGNLNPATFLPEKENETPDHDCFQFLTLNYAARENLMDTPLDNPDMEIFTDGSSFVQDGKHKAGYAVVTAEQVLEAKSLPQGISAQLVELVALTRALELSNGQRVDIYRDSKYVYLTLHAHAAIWKERQFKRATGEPIKHFREIERPLNAIVKSLSRVRLCDPMDSSISDSSIHGIFHARVLEWTAISFSRGSSRPRNRTWVSRIAGRHLYI